MRWLVALILVGGCDLLFELHAPPPPPLLPPGCSPTSLITDDFEGMGPPDDKWLVEAAAAGSVAVQFNQHLQVQVQAGADVVVATRPYLELRENAVSVSVFIPGGSPVPPGHVTLELMTQDASNNRLVMSARGNQLVAEKIEDEQGVPTVKDVGQAPYDRLDPAMRFWRIRQQGTTTFWETSADGTTFTPLFEDEGLEWVGFMRAIMHVHAEVDPVTVEFDNFNGGGLPEGQACPADALRDNFAGDVIGDQWKPFVGRCAFDLVDGGVLASFVGTIPDEIHTCALDASTFYDLRDHPIAIEVADIQTSQALSERVLFVVRTLDGLEGAFEQKGGELFATAEGSVLEETMYDPDAHRWWQFSAVDGELIWEVSADGARFEQFANTQLGPLGPLDVVSLSLAFQGKGVEPAIVRFEGVNTR